VSVSNDDFDSDASIISTIYLGSDSDSEERAIEDSAEAVSPAAVSSHNVSAKLDDDSEYSDEQLLADCALIRQMYLAKFGKKAVCDAVAAFATPIEAAAPSAAATIQSEPAHAAATAAAASEESASDGQAAATASEGPTQTTAPAVASIHLTASAYTVGPAAPAAHVDATEAAATAAPGKDTIDPASLETATAALQAVTPPAADPARWTAKQTGVETFQAAAESSAA
ncbi:hypothetical protein PMAYCL1PPCAC_10888, partial [Pristionchus mayeri]